MIHEDVNNVSSQNPQQNKEAAQAPDKAAYMQRVLELPAEDQAFLDGFLFARVTAMSRRPA